ncbi:SspB family protein [Telmatospirillum sp. J64-1]|uniref:SspB family protein n=1 Tax=Telmatospirillum sp. J64-1 TaxID=2502183 RepID=UPI00115DBD14|nr:ClpXP protease specificity-enhancing factor SspB [Telmatospirillum sp. J64-1]
MSEDDTLRYDRMVEDALRGVVREALEVAATTGLPGQHHFYITFRTDYPGVRIPGHLRARHPEEMTIVLQHQFWGLEINDLGFEVTLSFNRVNERLAIPFAAVTGFADPSAKFGLQFQVDGMPEDFDDEDDGFEGNEDESQYAESSSEDAPEERGQVIALDAFRKK